MKIEINHGRLIDPRDGIDKKTSLFIAAGKVAAIGSAPPAWHANRVIDAAGMIVCPGLIDISARLREPGFEYKATLESELQAAIAGGVTSLACPPDTDPPLDEPGLVEMLKHRARSLNLAHVYPIGALTAGLNGATITEMGELAEAGCIAFSHADAPLADTQVLLRAMQYAATFGYRVWLRPQDAHLSKGGVAHDGEVAMRLGLPAIPACAETIALGTIFALAGLADGTIDLLCSDHTPVDDDGKQLPFAEAEPGATGLELLLPLTLKWAREDRVPLASALARVTADPARVLGVDAGHLAVGAPADVCIFDPEQRWIVLPGALKSQGKNTPFLGLELQGKVRYTLVGGQIVHEG